MPSLQAQQERREERQERREEHLERREERREDRGDYERREERREERQERREDRLSSVEVPANPVFHPGKATKILFSPGIGAGWITYAPKGASDGFLVFMLTFEPLIRALENRAHKDRLEELLKDFHQQARTRFNVERIVCARAGDLMVHEVDGPFEVREKEGAEWIVDVSRRRIVPMGAIVY